MPAVICQVFFWRMARYYAFQEALNADAADPLIIAWPQKGELGFTDQNSLQTKSMRNVGLHDLVTAEHRQCGFSLEIAMHHGGYS